MWRCGEQRNVRGSFWRTATSNPLSSSASSKNTRPAVLVGDKIERVTGLEQLQGALPPIGAPGAFLSGRKKPERLSFQRQCGPLKWTSGRIEAPRPDAEENAALSATPGWDVLTWTGLLTVLDRRLDCCWRSKRVRSGSCRLSWRLTRCCSAR